jgi:hypothetical protein
VKAGKGHVAEEGASCMGLVERISVVFVRMTAICCY